MATWPTVVTLIDSKGAEWMTEQNISIIDMMPYIKKVAHESCKYRHFDVDDFTQEMVAEIITQIGNETISCYAVTLVVLQAKNKVLNTMHSKKYSHSSKSHFPHFPFPPPENKKILYNSIGYSDIDIDLDVKKALRFLTKEQKRLVYLVYWKETPMSEIANLYGLTAQTIHDKIKRAIYDMRVGLGVK